MKNKQLALMKEGINFFQPDSVQVNQPDTLQVTQPDSLQVTQPAVTEDTSSSDASIPDTLLQAKPLPFPEERPVARPTPTKKAPVKTVISEEQLAKQQKIEKQNQLDSTMSKDLQELHNPFITISAKASATGRTDEHFLKTEVKHQTSNTKPLTYSTFSPDWIFAILLISSFTIILIRNYFDKYLNLVFKAYHNYQFSFKLFKDQSVLYNQLSYILNLNSALVMGLFFFQLIRYSATQSFLGFSGFGMFLVLPAFLISLYVLQYVLYYFLGNLTLRMSAGKEYLHHAFMLNKIMGLVFIPVTLGIAYLPEYMRFYLVYLGIFIIIIFYLKRIQRGITILKRNHVLKFYWILYFCTLEILPVLVMVKLLITFI